MNGFRPLNPFLSFAQSPTSRSAREVGAIYDEVRTCRELVGRTFTLAALRNVLNGTDFERGLSTSGLSGGGVAR